jgi:rhodanese-related sulfurtransferase
MKQINVHELKSWMDQQVDFQLIDVREPEEFEALSMGGILIPMNEIPGHIAEIDREKPVVIHCRSGMRSASVIDFLERNFEFVNLYNLEGGILAWYDEIVTP